MASGRRLCAVKASLFLDCRGTLGWLRVAVNLRIVSLCKYVETAVAVFVISRTTNFEISTQLDERGTIVNNGNAMRFEFRKALNFEFQGCGGVFRFYDFFAD